MEKFKKAQQQLHASQSTENDWNLLQTCVSLLQNIGDFQLKLVECREKIAETVREKKKQLDENISSKKIPAILSNYRHVSKREESDFHSLAEKAQVSISSYDNSGILSSVFSQIKPICEYIHDTTLATIFTPIENQLKASEFSGYENNDSSSSDLPDYSFAPQEFITVIGQVSQYYSKRFLNHILM